MCEFISWIVSGGKLFYLTDQDIFSEHGREVLAGCKDNDFLGHGAIREFWNLQGGAEKEERDFWNFEKLPKELALMVRDFDKHWSKTFKTYFQNDDLRHIIYDAPNEWKAKALGQLLKQKPGNSGLTGIIIYAHAPEELKAKVWKQLLKQKPGNSDLSRIINYAPEKWKDKARKMLEGSR